MGILYPNENIRAAEFAQALLCKRTTPFDKQPQPRTCGDIFQMHQNVEITIGSKVNTIILPGLAI